MMVMKAGGRSQNEQGRRSDSGYRRNLRYDGDEGRWVTLLNSQSALQIQLMP